MSKAVITGTAVVFLHAEGIVFAQSLSSYSQNTQQMQQGNQSGSSSSTNNIGGTTTPSRAPPAGMGGSQ